MPRRRRILKVRSDRLTHGQRTELLDGHPFFMGLDLPEEQGFGADEAGRREAWAQHGAALVAELAETNPGERPWGWWRYDAPEPRDTAQHETLQLLALGEIGSRELEELKKTWTLYDRQARQVGSRALHLTQQAADATYMARRRFYGIPDTWRAPAMVGTA